MTLTFAPKMTGPTVEFRSAAFPKYADEDAEIINSNCWGKRLAEFVRDNLPKYGAVTEDILCEDWGWLVYIQNDDFPLWVGCGAMDDPSAYEEGHVGVAQEQSIDVDANAEGPIEFCMFVAAEPGFFRRLFKRIDTAPDVARVVSALRRMIDESPHFDAVVWSE